MKARFQQPIALLTAWAVALFCMPGNLAAQERIVPSSEFHQQLQKASDARKANLEVVQRVLSTDQAKSLLEKSKLDSGQVLKAVAHLNDAELARVADQARVAEKDVAGGLIVGILALIGLIVVIIVVARAVSD